MDKEHIFMQMEINMQENGNKTKEMDKEHFFIQMDQLKYKDGKMVKKFEMQRFRNQYLKKFIRLWTAKITIFDDWMICFDEKEKLYIRLKEEEINEKYTD